MRGVDQRLATQWRLNSLAEVTRAMVVRVVATDGTEAVYDQVLYRHGAACQTLTRLDLQGWKLSA